MEEEKSDQRPCDAVLDDESRGRLVLDLGHAVRHPLSFLRAISPFPTAHHPQCSHFEGHSISIRGRKWCIGCTFNTISFFSAMSMLLLVWILNPALLNRFYLFWGGVVGSALYFLISFSGITEDRARAKILSKFILGSSFAAICWSVLLINGLLSPGLEVKLLLILVLYLCFVTVMNIKRSIEILRECEGCEYKMRWSKCPGFREIACRLVEEGFVSPEAS
ncbi:hypothetical protein EU545_05775 [Candidatus Thorarchaeota archaeon]|nr:MAG: hypothetical protein EU545_05775 [Candidatus Thorarchaeota archaeon]